MLGVTIFIVTILVGTDTPTHFSELHICASEGKKGQLAGFFDAYQFYAIV